MGTGFNCHPADCQRGAGRKAGSAGLHAAGMIPMLAAVALMSTADSVCSQDPRLAEEYRRFVAEVQEWQAPSAIKNIAI